MCEKIVFDRFLDIYVPKLNHRSYGKAAELPGHLFAQRIRVVPQHIEF